MEIGQLKQKASSFTSIFTVICMIVTVGLLFVMQKSTAAANNINAKNSDANWQSYLD